MGGQKVADISLKSTYHLPDLKLKSSEGPMTMGNSTATLKFVRKD